MKQQRTFLSFAAALGFTAIISCAQTEVQTPPERTTFSWPAQLKKACAPLEKAGIKIYYGQNTVPHSAVIIEEEKNSWTNMPQPP